MVTILAAGAACLGLHNGAGWSRERRQSGLRQSSFSNGWPVEELLPVTQSDASKGLMLGDLRSIPHAIRTESIPSLIDVMQDKWFGSPSAGSSMRFTDSSGGLSQSGQHARHAEGASARHSTEESWQSRGEQASHPSSHPTTSDQSRNAASTNGSHSSSRSISHQSVGRAADAPPLWVLTQLDGFSTPLTPTLLEEAHTPDWQHDAALTDSESGCDTPFRDRSLDLDMDMLAAALPASNGYLSAQPALRREPSEGEGFGTWAGRQKHFGAAVLREEAAANRAASQRAVQRRASVEFAADAYGSRGKGDSRQAGEARPASPSAAIPGLPIPKPPVAAPAISLRGGDGARGSGGAAESSLDEDKARDAAWRWRFGRRWRAEQAKQLDPTYGQEVGDEDTWDAALGYLDACGGGYRLQIARTASMDNPLEHSVMGSSQLLLEEDSYTANGSLADTADLNATKQIGEMAKKAHELMQHQEEIERRVSQRWGDVSTAGDSWAGHYLPAVQVDSYGNFPFVLIKVADRSGVNKLLVRGKNLSSEPQLLQAAHKEVAQVCSTRRVPPVTTQLVGGGVMEWSRDRDRYLNVSEGRVVMGSHSSVQTKGDVARLAGALTRCSLPMHYHITVEGQKLM